MSRRKKSYATSADIRRAIVENKFQEFQPKKYISKDLTVIFIEFIDI
jgi:hypothetical protein